MLLPGSPPPWYYAFQFGSIWSLVALALILGGFLVFFVMKRKNNKTITTLVLAQIGLGVAVLFLVGYGFYYLYLLRDSAPGDGLDWYYYLYFGRTDFGLIIFLLIFIGFIIFFGTGMMRDKPKGVVLFRRFGLAIALFLLLSYGLFYLYLLVSRIII